jgi:hypothetical protein
MKIPNYFLNCFLLLIPIFIWNLLFTSYLPKSYSPDFFWKDIPVIIKNSENILRIIVFSLPIIMKFSLKTNLQKKGFFLYILGVLLYFGSWLMQIYFPEFSWSKSMLGFMAPAYTTLIWFLGIGLIGNKSFIKIPHISLLFILVSSLFVIIHILHAYLIFKTL